MKKERKPKGILYSDNGLITWTKNEEQFIIDNFDKGYIYIINKLNRIKDAIKYIANKLGLIKSNKLVHEQYIYIKKLQIERCKALC